MCYVFFPPEIDLATYVMIKQNNCAVGTHLWVVGSVVTCVVWDQMVVEREAVAQAAEVFCKKRCSVLLEIVQTSQEKTCARVS